MLRTFALILLSQNFVSPIGVLSFVVISGNENVIKAVFEYAYINSKYKISDLFIKRRIWHEIILPYIVKFDNNKISKRDLCIVVGDYLEFGWDIGFENPDQIQMNQSSYNKLCQDRQTRIEIARDITNSLLIGKAVGWLGPRKNIIPQFIREKKVDPNTGKVLKWRVIRDASKGTDSNPSMNMMTPKWKGNVDLVYLSDLLNYAYIMYLFWGPGCHAAKTDLDSAFRQFWLNSSQFMYCIYECYGKYICDTYNFWGTRTGSKLCQDVGQVVCRAISLIQNGTHLLTDINEAIENKNTLFFIKKLRSYTLGTDTDAQKWEKKLIFNWDKTLIKRWLISENLEILIQFMDLYLKNGSYFIALHENNAKRVMKDSHFIIFKRSQFFDKLIQLKIESRQYLVLIINNYIDDFLLFLPPCKIFANKLFKQFYEFLKLIGLAEKAEKRDGPNPLIEMTGFDINLLAMRAKYPEIKKFKIKELLFEGLITEFLDFEKYESLLGKLNDVASMQWPAKTFLKRLRSHFVNFVRKHGRIQGMIPLPKWVLLDFKWWVRYIDVVSDIDILEFCDPFMPEDEMHFDGATNGSREKGWNPGMGVWYKGQFIMAPIPAHFTETFSVQERDYEKDFAIAHFEMIAIITGLHTFGDQLKRGSKLTLRTDSQHVLSVMKSKNSDDIFLQSCLRWLCMFAIENNIRLYVLYVTSKRNSIPDAASRFDKAELLRHALRECHSHKWQLIDQSNDFLIPNIHKW